MKRVMVVVGSRADAGMLIWPLKVLREDGAFDVDEVSIRGCSPTGAFAHIEYKIRAHRPEVMMVLGDRFEILASVMKAHLERVPIAHICGGDVTEGSYDDAMRDAISRMSSVHFVASTAAMARLTQAGYHNVHLVGSTGIDFIKHADWRKKPPYDEPYVVVSYQAETIDGTNEIRKLLDSLDLSKRTVFILPNKDMLSDEIADCIAAFAFVSPKFLTGEELELDRIRPALKCCVYQFVSLVQMTIVINPSIAAQGLLRLHHLQRNNPDQVRTDYPDLSKFADTWR